MCVGEGHLEMVKFLLEAGADQEHKTDEMHTALMEASMDGHVEVARLLLDHGAQVTWLLTESTFYLVHIHRLLFKHLCTLGISCETKTSGSCLLMLKSALRDVCIIVCI